MMKQSNTLFDESDSQFLRGIENRLIVLRTDGCGDIFYSGAGGTEYIVDEGELDVIWVLVGEREGGR